MAQWLITIPETKNASNMINILSCVVNIWPCDNCFLIYICLMVTNKIPDERKHRYRIIHIPRMSSINEVIHFALCDTLVCLRDSFWNQTRKIIDFTGFVHGQSYITINTSKFLPSSPIASYNCNYIIWQWLIICQYALSNSVSNLQLVSAHVNSSLQFWHCIDEKGCQTTLCRWSIDLSYKYGILIK